MSDVVADAYVVSGVGTASQSVAADAVVRVAGGTSDVQADGYVSVAPLGGRLVSIADGDWHNPAIWAYADAEETSGGQLIHPRYARELRFTPGVDYAVGGFLLPVDGANDPGGTLTVELGQVSGGTLVASAQGTLPAAARSPSAGVEFYHVRFSVPVVVLTGQTWYVRVLAPGDNIAPAVVTSARVVGGIASYVVNGIVVSTTVATAIEGRSVVVAPLVVGGVRGGRTLTFAQADPVVYRTVHVCPGATVLFDEDVDAHLRVGKVLQVGGGALLSLAPAAGHTARIAFAEAEAGMIVNGTVSCAGRAKTRLASLATPTTVPGTALALDAPPTGWEAGDRLLVQTTDGNVSKLVTLEAVAGSSATLTAPVGSVHAAGARVVNLSRAVAIAGKGILEPTTLRVTGTAHLTLDHTELRHLGPGVALAPHPDAVVDLLDVVFAEGATLSAGAGPTALIPGEHTTLEQITVYRYRGGIVLASGRSHVGTAIVADTNVAHTAIVVQGVSAIDAVGIGINGALVNVWAGGRFTGNLESRWAFGPGASLVACVAGAVAEVTLTGGAYTGVNGNGAVLYVGPAGGLGKALLENVTSDRLALLVDSGVNYAGRVVLRGCGIGGATTPLVQFAGVAFADLVDEDGVKNEGVSLIQGTPLPGTRVATRFRSEGVDGYHARTSGEIHAGTTALELHATAGRTYELELARIPVTTGEVVRFGCWVKGTLTLALRGSTAGASSAIASPGAWGAGTIEATADATGVVVLVARVSATTAYLDDVERL